MSETLKGDTQGPNCLPRRFKIEISGFDRESNKYQQMKAIADRDIRFVPRCLPEIKPEIVFNQSLRMEKVDSEERYRPKYRSSVQTEAIRIKQDHRVLWLAGRSIEGLSQFLQSATASYPNDYARNTAQFSIDKKTNTRTQNHLAPLIFPNDQFHQN